MVRGARLCQLQRSRVPATQARPPVLFQARRSRRDPGPRRRVPSAALRTLSSGRRSPCPRTYVRNGDDRPALPGFRTLGLPAAEAPASPDAGSATALASDALQPPPLRAAAPARVGGATAVRRAPEPVSKDHVRNGDAPAPPGSRPNGHQTRGTSAIGYILLKCPSSQANGGADNGGAENARASETIEGLSKARGLTLVTIARDLKTTRGEAQARPALHWVLDQLIAGRAQTLVVARLADLTDNAATLSRLLRWLRRARSNAHRERPRLGHLDKKRSAHGQRTGPRGRMGTRPHLDAHPPRPRGRSRARSRRRSPDRHGCSGNQGSHPSHARRRDDAASNRRRPERRTRPHAARSDHVATLERPVSNGTP